ncbi:MAG: hypothetical protein D6725_10920 [Planctomycetota bacterium]|nr:MAG: hypothetical protein D6725_10920 [Planctomycetota bacterium]
MSDIGDEVLTAGQTSGPSEEWQPRAIELPQCAYSPLKVFASREKALEHIASHILGEGESAAWAVVLGDDDLVGGDLGDPRFRHRVHNALCRESDAFDRWYGVYSRVIELNLRDACELDWKAVRHESDGWVGVALGTCGVVIVAENGTVLTAFLPQQTEETPKLLRGKRSMRGGRDKIIPHRHAERWGREERLYFRVFKPAVQFLRRAQTEWFEAGGGMLPRSNDYAMLKDRVPRTSRMTLRKWLAWRRRCRGGGGA